MAWQTVDLSKPTETKETNFEIELDLENNNDGNNPVEHTEASETPESPEEKVQEETKENKEEVKEPEVKGKSRAKRRIERLNREKKIVEERLSNENAELKRRLEALEQGTNTSQIETKITSLEDNARTLQSQIAAANKDGEYEKAASLQSQLTDVLVDVKVLKATKENTTAKAKTGTTEQANERPATQVENNPEALEDWIDENPWFQDPDGPQERRLARYIKNQGRKLIQEEGFQADDDDLYDTLNELAAKFVKEKNYDIDGFEKAVEKPETKKEKRGPSTETPRDSGVSKVGNKIKVKLTEDERRIAKRFGMSDEDYAKQKILLEDKKTGSWSSVF